MVYQIKLDDALQKQQGSSRKGNCRHKEKATERKGLIKDTSSYVAKHAPPISGRSAKNYSSA